MKIIRPFYRFLGRMEESFHVMKAIAATQDQDVVVTKRRQSSSDLHVRFAVEGGLQGDLNDGNISQWIHDHEWHKHTMIESALSSNLDDRTCFVNSSSIH